MDRAIDIAKVQSTALSQAQSERKKATVTAEGGTSSDSVNESKFIENFLAESVSSEVVPKKCRRVVNPPIAGNDSNMRRRLRSRK